MSVKIKILSTEVDALTIDTANSRISDMLKSRTSRSHYVVKPYVEFIELARKDKEIRRILNSADLVLADGVSLQWAASYLYGKPQAKFLRLVRSLLFWLQDNSWRDQVLPEKMAGASQTLPLMRLAAKNGWNIGVVGGSDPYLTRAAIKATIPTLEHLTVWNGYFDKAEEAALVSDIASKKLDILFVAMGFPRQEKFMYKHLSSKLAKVLIGEGGTFDYHVFGGSVKRAPEWMQRAGLEWLFRLIIQPRRLIRQLSIPRFIYHVYRQAKSLR